MKSNIEIRKARFSDINQIANVHSRSAFTAYKDIMSKEILEGFWNVETLKEDWSNYIIETKKDKSLFAYVAVENDEVIGILRANNANEHDKEIFNDVNVSENEMDEFIHFKTIYIHPDHQGRGIGKNFITHVAKDVINNGKSKLMTITTDKYEDSPRFFKSFGAKFAGKHAVDMKEHYDTTTSNVDDSKLITNVWFMDAKEILDISADKEKRYQTEKENKINKISIAKQRYYAKNIKNINIIKMIKDNKIVGF